jgi:hypothetical protein
MLLWPAFAALPSSHRFDATGRRGKPPHSRRKFQAVFPFADFGEREIETSRKTRTGNSNFVVCRSGILAPAPNWRLEAAITGTLGSVPLHCGGRHLCLPVSAASSRVIRLPWRGCQVAPHSARAHLDTAPEHNTIGARLCAKHSRSDRDSTMKSSAGIRRIRAGWFCEAAAAGLRHSRAPGQCPVTPHSAGSAG